MALRTAAGGAATGGAFGTDLHVMDSSVQHVRQTGEAMISRVNGMFAELDAELHSGTFAGPAAAAYVKAKADWHVAHQRHIQVLDEIATAIHKSRTGYQQADETNRAGIIKATQGLHG